jgi:hypothetical protein
MHSEREFTHQRVVGILGANIEPRCGENWRWNRCYSKHDLKRHATIQPLERSLSSDSGDRF